MNNEVEEADNVVDLTRASNGGHFGMDIYNAAAVGRLETEMSNFLTEVRLGSGIRACYFKNMIPEGTDFTHFDLAIMKIPVGFRYVDYTINAAQEVVFDLQSSQLKPALKSGLFTPLLLPKQSSTNSRTEFHICENKRTVFTRGGSIEGCSDPLGEGGLVANARPFELFYFEGDLRWTKSYEIDGKQTVTHVVEFKNKGRFLLIPLVLSEKTVVYYIVAGGNSDVDPEDFSPRVTDFYRELIGYKTEIPKPFVDAVHPLVLNDKLGIFATNKVECLA
jgi:hypothetical protein